MPRYPSTKTYCVTLIARGSCLKRDTSHATFRIESYGYTEKQVGKIVFTKAYRGRCEYKKIAYTKSIIKRVQTEYKGSQTV